MKQVPLSKSSFLTAQIEQAIAVCLEEISVNPSIASAYLTLGDLYVQQQRWQLAKEAYRQAITIEPNLAIAYRQLAEIFAIQGNESQAADHLYQAWELEPLSITAQEYYKLGQTLASQNKPAKAIACYQNALKMQPDYWQAYQTLATFLTQQGKNERAIEVYRQGVKHNPQNAQYYLALAQALAANQQWVRASNNYRHAAQLSPSAEIYYHWALTSSQLKEYNQAREYYRHAAELAPSAEIYYHWGLTLSQIKEYNEALGCYQKAIAFKADYWQVYYQLGLIWQQQQQWEKALLAYQKARQIQPQAHEILLEMGLIYQHLQQFDRAIALYHEVIKNNPNSSVESKAFERYQQTVAQHPQPTVILYYQLAKLLRAKSHFDRAIAVYQKSIELDPYFRDAYIALQYTPIAEEQLDNIIAFYQQIVAKYPDITLAWGNLGDALTQKDNLAEAINCYNTACYQRAIQSYPHLAKYTWKEAKSSAPDFIIPGASKSGTSSLFYYLDRHPQILLSHIKEIDFYWKNYDKGIDWYLAHFPSLTDREDFLTGEATPNYLRFPLVAQRIKDTFPQVKIILLLRNPADRAISWHYHKFNTGLTKQNLKTAIATEIERLATISEAEITNTGFYNPDNILSSLYIYKIKPWIEILGRDQFLILKSEDFYSDPQTSMNEVFNFLGVANCPLDSYPKVNAGSYNQVDAELRKTLVDYFAPYNQQLEDYLGMQFNWE
ncbi:sulfotransferase [Chondrocystis sp. NIES-4102]|nr:sulfotransferase [Chondrocystis sp. NIES-4102]